MIMQYIQEHVQEQFYVPKSMFQFNLLWIHSAKQLKQEERSWQIKVFTIYGLKQDQWAWKSQGTKTMGEVLIIDVCASTVEDFSLK